jgi:hypothetical protein
MLCEIMVTQCTDNTLHALITGSTNSAETTAAARFDPRSGYVAFVVDKVALGQVLSEYFGFPCQFLFHRLFHIR